jgi:hypothetical protein
MPELGQRERKKMRESAIPGAMTQDKDQSLKPVEQQTYGRLQSISDNGDGPFYFHHAAAILCQKFFCKNIFPVIKYRSIT